MDRRQYSSCPYGFVIPEGDTTDSRLVFYNDTNCAYGCKSNFYTSAQWDRKMVNTTAFGLAGFTLSTLFVLLWVLDSERRRQHLIITLGVFTWISSLATVFTTGQSFNEKFCETNAICLDMSFGVSTCTLQAGLLQFGSLGTSCAWLSQALDLFLKIVLERNTTSRSYEMAFLGFNLALPLFSLLWLLVGEHLGYSPGYCYCFLNTQAPFYIYFVTIGGPLFVIAVSGIILMAMVMEKIGRTSTKTRCNNMESLAKDASKVALDLLGTLKIPILFCILFLVLSLSVIVLLVQVAVLRETKIGPSTTEFDECVFTHWDEVSDQSWQVPCGLKQSEGYSSNNWLVFCVTGQSIFISMIFLPFALTKLPSDVKRLLVAMNLIRDDSGRRRRYNARKKKRTSTVPQSDGAGVAIDEGEDSSSYYSERSTTYRDHDSTTNEGGRVSDDSGGDGRALISSIASSIKTAVRVPRITIMTSLKIYSRDSSEKVYPGAIADTTRQLQRVEAL